MIPCCIAFGEAAGYAAAQAVKEDCAPADIDVQQLRQTLLANGAFLGE